MPLLEARPAATLQDARPSTWLPKAAMARQGGKALPGLPLVPSGPCAGSVALQSEADTQG